MSNRVVHYSVDENITSCLTVLERKMLLSIKDCPPYLVCYIGKLYAALGSVLKTFSSIFRTSPKGGLECLNRILLGLDTV